MWLNIHFLKMVKFECVNNHFKSGIYKIILESLLPITLATFLFSNGVLMIINQQQNIAMQWLNPG
jgi:hypothetical protein